MKEKDMGTVAELIARVAVRGEAPADIRADVREFKKDFTKARYCFFDGEEAYDYPRYDGDL
jgi:glycine hydroxymethyltransferase